MPTRFADLLFRAIATAGSPACVGLDPVIEKIPQAVPGGHPADRLETFSRGVIDAVRGIVGVVKPQSACFERYGSLGYAALERVVAYARDAGLLVILDAKRGDIGVTAEHYAAGVQSLGAHAITLSGYMGPSSVEPFLASGLGVFVLVRTSNPDSDRVQACQLRDGRTVAGALADMVLSLGEGRCGESGYSDAGAVVGATKSHEGQRLRHVLPRHWFLVPGYGAQGGTLADIRLLLDSKRSGVVVNASRSVLYASTPPGGCWQDAVAQAARALRDDLAALG